MPKAPKAGGTLLADQQAKPPQRRSALACLACRSAKNKCDGQAPALAVEISASQVLKASPSDDIPSDAPCTRCRRLELRCMWQPSHRTGRPRKKRRPSETLAEASLGLRLDTDTHPTHHENASAASSYTPDGASSSGSLSAITRADITGQDIFTLLNTSPYDSTESTYSNLDAEHIDDSDPSADDALGSSVAQIDSSPAEHVAAWSAAIPPSAGLNHPAGGQPYRYHGYTPDEYPAPPTEGPSRHAQDHFSMLRSRIGAGVRKDRGMEIGRRPANLWPALPSVLPGHESDLQRGLRLYFGGFGLSVPILGEEEKFFAARFAEMPDLSPSPLILHAAAALGLLLQDGKDASSTNVMRARARELADVTAEQSTALYSTDHARVLSAIQGLILVAYDDYGRTQIPAAARYMRAACELALHSQLNLLDSGRTFAEGFPSGPNPLGGKTVSFAGIGSSQSFTPDFLEDCRRTWWELYIADLMFQMTTSGKLKRTLSDRQMVVAVNSPKDPGDDMYSEAYDIRIRAAALIHECTKPPLDPRNPDLGRLHAVDTMLSNLLLRGQSMWASVASSASRNFRQERPSPVVETKLEIVFTAMVVMQAARIHLHRQAWFSDLQMDLESCSFKPKPGVASVPAPSSIHGSGAAVLSEEARRNYIADSVSTIISCADGILRLIRLDAEMHLDMAMMHPSSRGALQPSPVPPHWPFFTCCSMVASFGYAVAVAASGPQHSALPSYRDEIRLRMGAGETSPRDPNLVANIDYSIRGAENPTMETIIANWESGGASGHRDIDTARNLQYELAQQRRLRDEEAYIWKTRAALSNISFAETTLSLYATVWPMAAVYQAEVRKCKGAVDLGGPTGFGTTP
ncbi:hypothetical protein ACQY0O_008249 [Thecaphora frezii]